MLNAGSQRAALNLESSLVLGCRPVSSELLRSPSWRMECPPPRSAARLLDKLCGHYIEDHIVTFQNKNAEGLDAC